MNRSLRAKLLPLALTFVLAFGITIPAAAQGIVTGDTVPAGTVLNQDVVLVGQNVTVDGTVNGNVFILGNQVTVNGTVDGSLIIIGQNAGIGGTVTGGTYAAALTLDLAPHAALERDLYVATVSLTSGADSVIGRDLYAVGLDSGLNGQVVRNLHTVIGPIQLYNGLMTLLGFENLTIKLHFETPQPSGNAAGLQVPISPRARLRVAVNPAPRPFDWGKWALNLLRNWAVLFVFSLLALWLMRKPLDRSGQPLRAHPWRTIGAGLLVLVISIALIGVLLLLSVLIFAIGLGLNALGLWQLSVALWAAAYACLALALVALWFFISYGTKIIAIYVGAAWVFGKLFQRKAFWLDLLALLAGTVVYILLLAVPFIGWVFGLLVTAAGAGAAWLTYRQSRRKTEPVPVEITKEMVSKLPAKVLSERKTKKTPANKKA